MKPTHIAKNGQLICYKTIKFAIDTDQIEFAVNVLLDEQENNPAIKINKSTVIEEIQVLLYQCGRKGQDGLQRSYPDWDEEGRAAWWSKVKVVSMKLFPEFYKK